VLGFCGFGETGQRWLAQLEPDPLSSESQGVGLTARAIVVVSVALLALACRSTPIGAPIELSVPGGLTSQEAELAVVTVLAAPPDRRPQPNTSTIVLASPLGAMLWDQYRNSQLRSKHWFLESWTDGEIFAGHQRSSHYLRVRIKIDRSKS
jgi:hypothetical protein